MAFFIVFEGGEGSGKTTQARKLYSTLCNQKHRVRIVHEPGDTALGKALRGLIATPREALFNTWKRGLVPVGENSQLTLATKDFWLPLVPQAELFLFEASRAQLVAEVIKPSLQSGVSVICDRYIYSTVAYQGHGRNLDIALIETLNRVATGGLEPDLVVFLDVPPGAGLSRKTKATEISRFEEEALAFHQRVRDGYLKQAAASPQRWFTVDALLPKIQISDIIWDRVQKVLKDKR